MHSRHVIGAMIAAAGLSTTPTTNELDISSLFSSPRRRDNEPVMQAKEPDGYIDSPKPMTKRKLRRLKGKGK